LFQVPKNNLLSITPKALLFLSAADFQHLKTLRDKLHSGLRENPVSEKGVFVGKMKFGVLLDRLVYIAYVCSGFSLFSSK
jgi:hypothetical protein